MPQSDALRNDRAPCLYLHQCDAGVHDLCSQDHHPDVARLYGDSVCRRLYAESGRRRRHDVAGRDHLCRHASSCPRGRPNVSSHRRHGAASHRGPHDGASLLSPRHDFSLTDSHARLSALSRLFNQLTNQRSTTTR